MTIGTVDVITGGTDSDGRDDGVTEPPAVAASARPSRRGWLKLAGVIAGTVLVAGALFGGGVLVGTQIPQTGGFGQGQLGPGTGGDGSFPTGPNGQGGPGPVTPNQDGTQQDDSDGS